MREATSIQTDAVGSEGGELNAAREHMARELLDGVRHGFFEMTVTVEMMQSKKRFTTIKAGKSYRFIV
jgi:hypothetical protein